MALTAKDRLERLLAGSTAATSDSATVQIPAEALELHVDGVGNVRLPVRPADVKKLVAAARPAHFGKGEQTLHDPSVRDTWEITPEQVTLGGATWQTSLDGALAHLGAALGIPHPTRLRAELHSMLIYGKGQFFAAHQDSEKHDDMVATLVVALPAKHTGGELVVHGRDGAQEYAASREDLSLVAFYPDRHHEVRPVRTGHRITLTFNVLLEGAPTGTDGTEGPVEQAAALLRAHFSTPITRPYGTRRDVPARLALLLDHEYSRRGLVADRLKGEDARRGELVRAAAEVAGCEAILAQTEIQQTWEAAFDSHDGYGPYGYGPYGYDGDDEEDEDDGYDGYEDFEDDEPDADAHGVSHLLDDSVALTWWADPASTGEVHLDLATHEVCAVTPSRDLTPYSSEFQGYMGNYGNTVDRWYRRAALVIWPKEQGFTLRAEASPGWALDAILSSLARGDQERARGEATGLAAAWGRAASAELLSPALEVAAGVEDPEVALAVLAPFSPHAMTAEHAAQLAALGVTYPRSWWKALRQQWDGGFRLSGQSRREWVESELAGVCRALASVDARQVVDWLASWMAEWLLETVGTTARSEQVIQRERSLDLLGPALAAVLAVADESTGAGVVDQLSMEGDVVLPLLVSAVRAHEPPAQAAMRTLGGHLQERLSDILARPQRAADDWSIDWTSPGGEDADRLARFLASSTQNTLEWPLAAPRRQWVHAWIDNAALPVRHATRRTGRPYTLVLTKTKALFTRERDARRRDEQDLAMVRRLIQDSDRQA